MSNAQTLLMLRKLALTALALLISCGTGSESRAAATPVSVFGDSGDEWERRPAGYVATATPCERLPYHQVLPLGSDASVVKIGTTSIMLLGNRSAVRMLGYGASTKPAASVAATRAIRDMLALKQKALTTDHGSWSLADEDELERVQRLVRTGRIARYRPYLVRAFKWPEGSTQLVADLCSGYVRTIAYSGRPGRQPKPQRAAAVVFLTKPPKASFAVWVEQSLPDD
ncbi:MAG TPA: hypothetical protein VF079_07920 [Sphingomicrobium sp.]